jgi:hypothetical protein
MLSGNKKKGKMHKKLAVATYLSEETETAG